MLRSALRFGMLPLVVSVLSSPAFGRRQVMFR